ncbi:MAG: ATP-binding protein [Verrucomicrobiota bacterium]
MDTLRLPAKMKSLEAFRTFVREKAVVSGVSQDLVPKIELVLEEILTNQVFHAYRGGRGDAEIHCSVGKDGAFCIRFADWGPPFDPLKQPAPDVSLPLEERKPGGVGIYLTKHMASNLEYRRENDRNVLTAHFKG